MRRTLIEACGWTSECLKLGEHELVRAGLRGAGDDLEDAGERHLRRLRPVVAFEPAGEEESGEEIAGAFHRRRKLRVLEENRLRLASRGGCRSAPRISAGAEVTSTAGGGRRRASAARSGSASSALPASQAHSKAFGVAMSASGRSSSRMASASASPT